MTTFPAGQLNRQEIERVIDDVTKALAPDLVFIGYSIGNDHEGLPSIFFRVVLSDQASKLTNLMNSINRVEATIKKELQPRQRLGLYPYFDYRSQAEQNDLRDPEWESHGVSR